MMLITNLSPGQLRRAADIKERIDALQNQLSELLGGELTTPAPVVAPQSPQPPRKRKRKMSAAGLANIRAAQQARWAKIKGTASPAKPAPKAKRKFSAAAIANIRAGVAKRMAAMKAAKPAAKPGPKHHISAAAKARLSALAKARWAKIKKAGKSRL